MDNDTKKWVKESIKDLEYALEHDSDFWLDSAIEKIEMIKKNREVIKK
jgi:hypothetical protein